MATTTKARPAAATTLGQRYNAQVDKLMPHMADDLKVDPAMDSLSHIDDLIFQKSEYLGGMAAVLLSVAMKA